MAAQRAEGQGQRPGCSCRHRLLLERRVLHERAVILAAYKLAPGLLGDFLEHERRAAVGTRLGDRPVPEREITVRIIGASVESLAAARLPLDDIAGVFGTYHAGGLHLHVLAVRVVRARGKLAEPPLLDHEVRFALRALL